MKIVILGAFPASLYNFRGDLISALCDAGHEVSCLAGEASQNELKRIYSMGASFSSYHINRNGLNPIDDIRTFWTLRSELIRLSPDVILAYTIKPVIWGAIANRISSRASFYSMITGIGYAFQKRTGLKALLFYLVKLLYKVSLVNSKAVIFQNYDNKKLFVDEGLVQQDKCHIVNGSGVNLEKYTKTKVPHEPRFLLISRLLKEKGVREFLDAAKIIKRKYQHVVFDLVGPYDPSPDGLSPKDIADFLEEGVVSYHGSTEDVRGFIRRSSIFVLPSYHEGMPRTVLEAMSMGRPIITTKVPGCKDTVCDGVNGKLVEKGSVEELAECMEWFILNPEKWQTMGDASYHMAQDKFDVKKINEEIINIIGANHEKVN